MIVFLNPLPRLKPGDSQCSYKLSMALIRADYNIHSLTYNRCWINERTALAPDSFIESKAGRIIHADRSLFRP